MNLEILVYKWSPAVIHDKLYRKSKLKDPAFGSATDVLFTESLILAQDERWRRA